MNTCHKKALMRALIPYIIIAGLAAYVGVMWELHYFLARFFGPDSAWDFFALPVAIGAVALVDGSVNIYLTTLRDCRKDPK